MQALSRWWRWRKTRHCLRPELSDTQFLLLFADALCSSGLSPHEFASYHRRLSAGEVSRQDLVHQVALQKINEAADAMAPHEPTIGIMGSRSSDVVSPAVWRDRASALALEPTASATSWDLAKPFVHTGRYQVSAIASLYKGGQFIHAFLENIVAQTLFNESELIIIDANSPEGEEEIIRRYQERYPNIVYKRLETRVGIYEAWNIGISIARGTYITNTNLDDLRHFRSFELQAQALQRHRFVDVVYQDFLYSLDPRFSFECAAKMAFVSKLPLVNAGNLLVLNSPHNAPMWRKSIHRDTGHFDEGFTSAGDYEFWLRCLRHNKTFLKIPHVTVAYFNNPKGLSTQLDSIGHDEVARIQRKYRPLLLSRYLQMSDDAFRKYVGASQPLPKRLSRVDLVEAELLRLVNQPGSGRLDRDFDRKPNVLVDGVVFQSQPEKAQAWARLIERLADSKAVVLRLLDRGDVSIDADVERIVFPPYSGHETAADSLLIENVCQANHVDVFISTQDTTPTLTSSVRVLLPSVLPARTRAVSESMLAMNHATRIVTLENDPREQAKVNTDSRVVSLASIGPRLGTEAESVDLAAVARALEAILCDVISQHDADAGRFHKEWHRLREIQNEVDTWP